MSGPTKKFFPDNHLKPQNKFYYEKLQIALSSFSLFSTNRRRGIFPITSYVQDK